MVSYDLVFPMTLISNAKWNAFSQLFKIIIQLLNLIYLAKIIPPSEYGLMAMTAVVVNLGTLLRDLGTSAALIQRKELNEKLKNTIFWINLIMGIAIAIAICLLSPVLSAVYNQPELLSVFILISVIFPLSSSAAAHLALMERASQFRKISYIEITSSVFSVIVAIIMANLGYGVFSLVGQAITLNLMSAIQFWRASTWRPSIKEFICKEELRNVFGFSANLSMFNLINYLSRNGDSFIIGKYMSAAILGSYNLAYRIMLFPLQSLTFVASRSLYPILSRQQDDNEKINKTYNDCVFVIVLITAPLMTGIALLSHPFINLTFGNQWEVTADVLKWLAPTAIIQSILSTTGSVFTAKGRTDILMRLGILGTVLQFGSFLIGIHFSIVTFAFCYLIANVLNFIPVMLSLMYVISGSFFIFIRQLMPIIISTLVMLFVINIFGHYFIPINDISNYWQLILTSVVGAVIYVISMLTLSFKIRFFIFNKLFKVKS